MSAAPESLAPAAPVPVPAALSDEALRAALATAAAGHRSPVAVLAETTGLDAEPLAFALGAALRYPVLDSASLMALEPAFDVLDAAEAARRGCVIVRRDAELLAITSDPFDAALRGTLELRIAEPLAWHLAAAGEITAYLAKHEQGLKSKEDAADEHRSASTLE